MRDDRAQALPAALALLDAQLDAAYHAPAHDLGNQADPLDEAVYIILTFQTDIPRARLVWAALKQRFPNWDGLMEASEEEVADLLRPGGLHRQRARTIKRLLAQVQTQTGELSLHMLAQWDDARVERFLCRLPGLSLKGARCVMLYSLGRAVLRIDGNAYRVLQRLGIIPSDCRYRRVSLHNQLQEAVAPERRRSLHVNLVVHGQRICTPLTPNCPQCSVRELCAWAAAGVLAEQVAAGPMAEVPRGVV